MKPKPESSSSHAMLMRTLLQETRARHSDMLRVLADFVRCESPSHDKSAVDRFGSLVAAQWESRDATARALAQKHRGDHLRIELSLGDSQTKPRRQILILGHLDTVYPLGTLAKMPYREARGKAFGPGAFDMKGGLILALAAIDALRATNTTPRARFVFLWNSDEEIGSETSRKFIEAEARRSDAVLVLEPSFGPAGKLKTSRKGVGTAELVVTGQNAHAGINPQDGVNAVHELALQIARLMQLNDPRRGLTVQTTVVSGGTTSNVVPDRARAEIDIRIARLADAARINKKLRSLKPILKGARIAITGGVNRPPLERTAAVERLFHHAQTLMHAAGLDLGEASTGGGSDGNFTAALGIPTLDGLGCVGDGAHSPHEHIVIDRLAERAALLAALLATL